MTVRRMALIALVAAVAVAVIVPASQAQEQVTVPTAPGETVTVTWDGTVLPAANTSSECDPADPAADVHEVDSPSPRGPTTR